MRFSLVRTFVASVFVCCVAGQSAIAQQPRPTPEQARAMLLARPDLVEQLRQRLLSSGLNREQIRARLRAEGYPEDMLDPYLGSIRDSIAAPTSDLYNAIRELGIADSADVEFLRSLQSDSLSPAARDSLLRLRDSTYRDSLTLSPRRAVLRADVADSLIRADSGQNIFGLEVFRSSSGRFEPTLFGPVDRHYKLGPGDRLVLILTGDVEESHTLDVTREGFIVIPQVGQLHVANLTLEQLEDVLYARLGRVFSGVRRGAGATTRFSVSVSRIRTSQIFVLGEVQHPGSYMVSAAGSALTGLYAAGGPTANGSFRNVLVRRGDRVVGTLDLYNYLLRGDASNDVRLETGDIVFVPARGGRVRVVGEVIRPATYEIREKETLADVLVAAGGLRPYASRQRVQIERVVPPDQRQQSGRDRITVDVAASDLADGGVASIPVEPGDVIRVFPVADRVRNTVLVRGNVWSPGTLGIREGMRLSEAVRLAGGLKPDTYLGHVLISRLQPDSSRLQLRAAFRDTTGRVEGDMVVREDDIIEVFSVTDFRPDRYVSIGGAVRRSGRYPFRHGMTMRDLVLLAGGLKESAYLREAEIARLPEDRTGATTAVTVRVPLDSTYLFDRRDGEPYIGAPGVGTSANGAPEVALSPYDNVLILEQPNWELQRIVALEGEVRFPGQYALRTRDERISDLIARAGGLTAEAYPEGTVFLRGKGGLGRVAIDVPRALRSRNSPDNMVLMDGDRITVPQRSNVVTVRGAVNAPNVVAFVPGRDIDYYIDQAGGAAPGGDRRRAFVTQPNGKRETKRAALRSPRPMPGSLVVVPQVDEAHRTNWVQIMSAVAPVLASLATLMIALR